MRIKEVAEAINSGAFDKVNEMKRIDFASGQFEANGKTYYLESQLTIGRYCEFVILQRELATGMTIDEIYKSMAALRKLLNDMRFVDAAVHTNNFINHCVNLKQKEPTVLKLCTLFINEKDEDRSKWGNDTVVRKLKDWSDAKIDVQDFFSIALTLVPTFTTAYNSFTHAITNGMESKKETEIVSALMSAK